MSFTLWFMGRPAAGKSTLAKRVEGELSDRGIKVENLDGDEVRRSIHPDLGFTREEREINNRRTAFICRLLNRNDIATIVAMITPFRDAQQKARELIEPEGDFVLIYVKCSVEACAERDPKNLYQQARDGKIDNFTGVNHPFQEPLDPDVIVNTENQSVDQCVRDVLEYITGDILEQEPNHEYQFNMTHDEESDIKAHLRDMGYID